jgi:hypothetical protein
MALDRDKWKNIAEQAETLKEFWPQGKKKFQKAEI